MAAHQASPSLGFFRQAHWSGLPFPSSMSESEKWKWRQWHPAPVLLPGKSYERRSLVGCSPWGREESDTTERLHFHKLEKEMATQSSVLAWRIPGTGKPGGLPFTGLHRVWHDWRDLASAAALDSACCMPYIWLPRKLLPREPVKLIKRMVTTWPTYAGWQLHRHPHCGWVPLWKAHPQAWPWASKTQRPLRRSSGFRDSAGSPSLQP